MVVRFIPARRGVCPKFCRPRANLRNNPLRSAGLMSPRGPWSHHSS